MSDDVACNCPGCQAHHRYAVLHNRIRELEEHIESAPKSEFEPGLVALLRLAGNEWGPLGVAVAAASLTSTTALMQAITGEPMVEIGGVTMPQSHYIAARHTMGAVSDPSVLPAVDSILHHRYEKSSFVPEVRECIRCGLDEEAKVHHSDPRLAP